MKITKKYQIFFLLSALALSAGETKPFWESIRNYISGENQNTNANQQQPQQQQTENQNEEEKTEQNNTTKSESNSQNNSFYNWIPNFFGSTTEQNNTSKNQGWFNTLLGFSETKKEADKTIKNVNNTMDKAATIWKGFLSFGENLKELHPLLEYTPHALVGFAGLTFLSMPITSIALGLGAIAYFNAKEIGEDVEAYQKDTDENKKITFTQTTQALKKNQNSLLLALIGGLGLGIIGKTVWSK